MFEWIIEIEEPQYNFHIDKREFSFVNIENTSTLTTMSPLCLLFTSPELKSTDGIYHIFPIANEYSLRVVLNEIVPHYKEAKKKIIDGQVVEIHTIGLKTNSKALLEKFSNCIEYEFAFDLYKDDKQNRPVNRSKVKFYSVNISAIKPISFNGISEVQRFIENTYFAKSGSINFAPKGWKLNSSLIESTTLRLFATFAKKIVLVVNEEDQSVIGLDIFG
ncbi:MULTISPECIES: hypothetical protein [Bacillus cereus group]|uniref:hypothetical protein n=1 Tax=Bacillus cereus group TaxID=86661 RepID=UPI00202CF74A|nr:hypothetical protein [Bacillus paranthracis]